MPDKKTVYQIVTDNIIALLDKGVVPWRKPWRSIAGASMPVSVRGYRYRGINTFILAAESMIKGYRSPIWLTFKQANELGGGIKAGEKSTLITFWKMLNEQKRDSETGEMKDVRIPLLRFYLVFNYEQTGGVKLPKKMQEIQDAVENGEVLPPEQSIDAAENIVAGYADNGPQIVNGAGIQACYSPRLDVINLARKQDFDSIEEYYSTLFHEFGHSTGHETRLNRQGIAAFDHFGSGQYAEEELVAEMTSAFLCGESGIETTLENSAAYIGNWKRKLQADPKLIVQVAGKAQKAADFILGTTFEQENN